MSYPLAVFAPDVGAVSETFIRRHMQDLLPGGVVVVTRSADGPSAGFWKVNCPTLVLDQISPERLRRQMVWAAARKLGWPPEDPVVKQVRQFLQKHQVRVVMGEYLDWSLRWLGLAQQLGIRFFGHAHGYDVSMTLRQPRWKAEYLRLNGADGVITMSRTSRGRLLELGLEPAKVNVIPYGVDVPAEPLTKGEKETIDCLAVGRMVPKKAPILTLDTFRRGAEVCPKLRLDYVGAGELFPAAQQFIRAFDLHDRVTLHGGQPRDVVQQLMRGADVFLQHSVTDPETGDEEGLPVGILEAMANSLPVVSTHHAGIPEAVLEGITGYLVHEGDSVGMAERLVTLARDPGLRQRMGAAGWRRVKEHFSWEKERTELLKVLGLGS